MWSPFLMTRMSVFSLAKRGAVTKKKMKLIIVARLLMAAPHSINFMTHLLEPRCRCTTLAVLLMNVEGIQRGVAERSCNGQGTCLVKAIAFPWCSNLSARLHCQ